MRLVRLATSKRKAGKQLGRPVRRRLGRISGFASTVDNHKARAMAKLGTDKAALLTRLAIKLKVTSTTDKLTPAEKKKSGRKDDGWN